jgi:hypothetical protein
MKLNNIIVLSLLGVLALFVSAGRAMALSSYLTTWKNNYAPGGVGSQSGANASCNLCHSSGGGTDFNGYGKDFANQKNNLGLTVLNALKAIESMNSDGDPTSAANSAEITGSAQPGWTPGPHNALYDIFALTVTLTNQNPPAITGNVLDPAATNHPPVLGAIGNKTVNEGQLLQFTASATDADSNALTFAGANLPTGASLTDNHNGTAAFAWTPAFNQAGNYLNVMITVTDNGSPPQNASQSFTITVGNVNRPPLLAAISNQAVNEGQLLQFTATATDPDGDALSFTASNMPTGAGLTDNHNGTAAFSWTPGFNQAGNYPNVMITVTDNGSPPQNASQSFTISVGNVNRPPVLGAIGNRTTSEGLLLQFTVTATDPDGDALSFTSSNMPTGAGLTDNHNGTATFNWTPAAGQNGNYPNVMITVTDNGSPPQNVSQSFTITVGNVNRPPVLGAIGNQTVNEGQLLSITITATDPDGNALSFTGANLPAGAGLVDNNNGTAALSWTPTYSQAGNYQNVTVIVTDNGIPPQNASQSFTITVGNVNRPPVLGAIGNKTVNEGQLLAITITATDPDGDALSFSGANLPAGASLVDNNNGTAALSWMPTYSQAGNYQNVTVTVTDNGIPPDSDLEAFTITVGNVNRPPVLGAIGNRTATQGQLLQFTITATDPDGDGLSFAAGTPPPGASLFDNQDGTATFSWTPTTSQSGVFTVTVTATDNWTPPASASQTFTITVQGSAPPPPPPPPPPGPGASAPRINKAEWSGEEAVLTVEGRGAGGRASVTIMDGDSGKTLGTARSNRGGEWKIELKLRRAPVPCTVKAKTGNQYSAAKTVSGTRRSCPGTSPGGNRGD